ncbi:helix-turn-helix transcriptional regulator [Mycolicibacterium helvum]|uniref:Transcriptional regulator n=1 Tax=Mycolicibacterium helvum TaxID=1534349 RepID=A0A7I7TDH5_9MYCO|nr:LuxR family transcriptional regulator [Mycolicibacterium helvum]BBY67227.1 transcriptional regulator [Mycolicibacterium helvum]
MGNSGQQERPDGGSGGFPLVGRDELVTLATDVARGAAGAPSALLLVGPAGVGKSVLLRTTLAAVSGADVRLVYSAGDGSTSGRPYAALSELIWPIVGAVDTLPVALGRIVTELLETPDGAARYEPTLVVQAMSALFDSAAATMPLLLAIDDVDGFDAASRDVVAAVIARWFGGRARALLTASGGEAVHRFDRMVDVVEVPALSDSAAAELLDLQPDPPTARVRGEVLRWAGGNPSALIEAARVLSRSSGTTFPTQGLGSPGGVYLRFAEQLDSLPADTRTLVFYAAVGAGEETVDALSDAAGVGDDWAPAVAAGVVRVTAERLVQFGHPVLRAAAYAESSAQQRRAAHQALSRCAHLDPFHRAWHAAWATAEADEAVAAALEQAAPPATRDHHGHLRIARGLQRAAELSPDRNDAARRYGLAATAANFGGDPAWALALSDDATHLTDDADLRGYAALTRASILLQSAHPLETFCLIQTVLNDPTPPRGSVALHLTYLAASAAYYSGEPRVRRQLHRWLALASDSSDSEPPLPAAFPTAAADLQRAYVRMYADIPDSPHGRPAGLGERWVQPVAAPIEPYRRLVAGVAGYVTEDSVLAARDLTKAAELLQNNGGLRGFSYALAPLAWALLDTGRWKALSTLLADTASLSAIADLALLDSETWACRAQLLAYRGDVDGAARALNRARRESSAAGGSRATEVALRRAAGWHALCAGDFDGAYQIFRQLFTDDGEPAHFVVSYRGIADVAWAAARSGRTDEVRPLLAAIDAQLGTHPPVRLGLLRHQALALVAATAREAEHHYRLAVFDPAGDDWPLERARARLHYGEWLRRARRPAEAKLLLTAAADVFSELGAQPLAEISAAELRAAGITALVAPASGAFAALTAQQQQIVQLAASGLTNREIADRLNLSPRTVGSHLYHVYPKLGISRRHELREFAP